MSEKRSKERVMDAVAEMRDMLVSVAGERGWGETRESWIAKAASRAGISYRTAKAIFYEGCADRHGYVRDRLMAAVRKFEIEKEASVRDQYGELTRQLAELRAQLDEARATSSRGMVADAGNVDRKGGFHHRGPGDRGAA